MPKKEEDIKRAISSYMTRVGGSARSWYVGITDDPARRLFNGHNVHEPTGKYISRKAYSAEVARRVEKHLVREKGADGGKGGGDENTVHVYAYRKTTNTNP